MFKQYLSRLYHVKQPDNCSHSHSYAHCFHKLLGLWLSNCFLHKIGSAYLQWFNDTTFMKGCMLSNACGKLRSKKKIINSIIYGKSQYIHLVKQCFVLKSQQNECRLSKFCRKVGNDKDIQSIQKSLSLTQHATHPNGWVDSNDAMKIFLSQ